MHTVGFNLESARPCAGHSVLDATPPQVLPPLLPTWPLGLEFRVRNRAAPGHFTPNSL